MNESDQSIIEKMLNKKISFMSIPKNRLTQEICDQAISHDIGLMVLIPDSFMTMENVKIYLQKRNDIGFLLCIKKQFFSALDIDQLCELLDLVESDKLVYEWHHILGKMPDVLKVQNTYDELISRYDTLTRSQLQWIPSQFITLNIINKLLYNKAKRTCRWISYVPQNILTPQMYLEAVKDYGMEIIKVPEEFITDEMCIIAVKEMPIVIGLMPDHFITNDILRTYLKSMIYDENEYEDEDQVLTTTKKWVDQINKINGLIQNKKQQICNTPNLFVLYDKYFNEIWPDLEKILKPYIELN